MPKNKRKSEFIGLKQKTRSTWWPAVMTADSEIAHCAKRMKNPLDLVVAVRAGMVRRSDRPN
jgi:hypothetical protein